MRTFFIFFALIFTFQQVNAQQMLIVDINEDVSFRALSVVDEHVAWIGGNKGFIGRSLDGGRHWNFMKIPEFQDADFRSIYAFDSQIVIIANAGSPACILRTIDGGTSWNLVYHNDDTSAFFDGIDFWNDEEGIIYGDPINNKMLLLHTIDGGKTWIAPSDITKPILADGEASFAASGTAIRCFNNEKLVIATGGVGSRLWISEDKGNTWSAISTPILQGEKTTGIFSVALNDDNHIIIVGGNYKQESLQLNHVFVSENGGLVWMQPFTSTGGYRECVEYIGKNIAIATGPTGTDFTRDGGKNWQQLCIDGFHVARKSRKGNLMIMAGAKGKIALLNLIKEL